MNRARIPRRGLGRSQEPEIMQQSQGLRQVDCWPGRDVAIWDPLPNLLATGEGAGSVEHGNRNHHRLAAVDEPGQQTAWQL